MIVDLTLHARATAIEAELRKGGALPDSRFDLIVACTEAAERAGYAPESEATQMCVMAVVDRIIPRGRS